MPHIHELIDFTSEVFVIYNGRMLLRKHDKYGIWLSIGGHIELDENPNEAAIREVKEEVGLEITLWDGNKLVDYSDHRFRELVPPIFLNVHNIDETHRHVTMSFIGFAESDELKIQDTEKGECRWFTQTELMEFDELKPDFKPHAIKAMELATQFLRES